MITPFADLTRRGKSARIGRLAAAALERYPLTLHSLRMSPAGTNLVFQVRTVEGTPFMLRLARPDWRTLEDLQAEAAWLHALADTDIGAPHVVPDRQGEPVVTLADDPAVPGRWHATLMSRIPGRSLAHALTPANLYKMGHLFARLHLHGKAWQVPAGFSTTRFDAFLSRGEPDLLIAGGVVQGFLPDDRDAFLRMHQQVQGCYAALDPADLRVIHCDLWHGNIRVDRGRLRPFDFEDTVWGYRLHDIAMGLLDLLETVGNERYAPLSDALRRGYEQVLAWPEGEISLLQAGRLLWKTNHMARFRPEVLPRLGREYGHLFRQLEATGEIRFPQAG